MGSQVLDMTEHVHTTHIQNQKSFYVHLFSVLMLCLTLCDPMDCNKPGFSALHYLPEVAQTHVHRVGDAIQPSHLLSSPSPPAFSLSQHQGLIQSVSSSHQVTQCTGASASSPVFPMNIQGWFPLWLIGLILLSKGLSSLFQHYNLKASILLHSAFFLVQLSPPYMTTGKTVALTRWTFVDKVMSLLFNVLSRFVIAFLPRSKHLLISWPQSLFTVILEPKEIKSVTVPISSPSFCHSFLNVEFKPAFHSPFILIKRLFSSSSLSAISYHSNIWGCYFSQQSWFQLVIHLAHIWCEVLCI